MLEDLNGWLGDRLRVGITGEFGVPGENDNGRKAIDLCIENGLSVIYNTYFKLKNLLKYTKVTRS